MCGPLLTGLARVAVLCQLCAALILVGAVVYVQ